VSAPAALAELTGLTESEAQARLRERGAFAQPASSRSYASIVRANVLNVFNAILAVAGGVTIAFGDVRDALFLYILVFNSAIGIWQEVTAKRALDRLAALVKPTATVVRNGAVRELRVEELVPGDLVRLKPGDQVVADGRIVASEGLHFDESILTGESQSVARGIGEEIRSGSFAVEGTGAYTVTAVGAQSYAQKLVGEARAFRHPRSPLERAVTRLLLTLAGVMVPMGVLLGYALWERREPTDEAIQTAVAGTVTLVPEGVILLVSLTYAVAALRMARRGALAQQLNAIESLASAEVICIDKTGTLTEPTLRVLEIVPAPALDTEEVIDALGRFAATSGSRNATLEAIAAAYPAPPAAGDGEVPFSSRYKWSGVRIAGTSYVLGAPEHFPLGPLAGRARAEAVGGRRVLAFGRSLEPLAGLGPGDPPPGGLEPLAIVLLAEQLRPAARETVEFFLAEGIELKVISGDDPDTVAAIARDAGIPLEGEPVKGTELPEDPAALRELVLATTVVGRITPEGKRRVVEALRDAGKYVAFVGDGVNDVPALKASRLAIAQAGGSQMAKTVADLVLVRGDFAAVPAMVHEGRKVLRNLQRVTKLFVTKSAFASFLILTIGLIPEDYPFLPRHLSLAAAVAIGTPAFFLALAPSSGPWRPEGFLRDVARFCVPAGTATGLGVLSSYLFALNVLDLDVRQAQTVAVTVLVCVGLYLILCLEAAGKKRGAAVTALCAALLAIYALAIALPATRGFFELHVPNAAMALTAAGGVVLSIIGLALTDDRRFVPGRGAPVAA
jgi:magnesium-transporting ATPase (P-type)